MKGNRSRVKLAVGVVSVFLMGVATGILGASLYFEGEMENLFHRRPPHGEEILKRLARDLHLTVQQQEEIRPIIMAFDRKARDLKEQFRPQMRQLHDEVATLIRNRLDGKQKKAFDEIDERLKKRFGESPPPSPLNRAQE